LDLSHSSAPSSPQAKRVCVLFPHLILGGGETAMMAVAEGLARHFEVAVCALDRRPMTVEVSARGELLRRFGSVSFVKTGPELRSQFERADAILWFGMNPFTPETLEAMPHRPASIRVVHTGKDEEGLDYHWRWRHCIDRVCCVSPLVARRIPGALFIPNTCSADRLEGAPLPCLPARGHAPAPGAPAPRPVLGFAGRLFRFKNVHWLIDHLAEIDCDLLVQGLDTEELTRAGLERLAADRGVAERVRFLPPSPAVGTLLRSVDAVIIASQQEGFPMIAVEAGMAGVPLIATRVGALPELLAEEVLFVDSEDGTPSLPSLRRAIACLEPAVGGRLRAKIAALCSQEAVSARYAQLIGAVLAERAPRRRRLATAPDRGFHGTLVLTHSSRGANLARCSPQFLASRFGDPGRLGSLPPFDSLRPARQLYSGAVSFFRISGSAGDGRSGRARLAVAPLGVIRCRDKLQHVTPIDARHLLAGFEHHVERWRLSAPLADFDAVGVPTVEGRFAHPHLAGLHTVETLSPGRAVLSCAASDAILLLDLETGAVERTLRLPESLYGTGYPLTPGSDLGRHYIHDELQTAHPNAAFADHIGRWVTVSTLIQGAVGIFDLRDGSYQEVTRGFVGCHGARFNQAEEIYFADSATGSLVVLGDDGRIARRFATGSRWLHDVQQVHGSLYAFALADRNELCIYDTARGDLLHRRRFSRLPFTPPPALAHRLPGWLGNSTQSLSYRPL
jgi:glycosyltransferase involved in cell wall biosynthesis